MSIKLMTTVWENAPLSGSHLLVLLALADWSNDQGVSWYGVRKIAQRARVSERQAQRILNDLELQGIIEKEQRLREDGSHTSNYYTIYQSKLLEKQEVPTDGGGDVDVTRGGDMGVTRGGDIAVSPQESSIKKHHQEPKVVDDDLKKVIELYMDVFGKPQPLMEDVILPEIKAMYSMGDIAFAFNETGKRGIKDFTYARRILENKAKQVVKNAAKKLTHSHSDWAEHIKQHPETYGE